MLSRERRYSLLSGADFYVDVRVHPCCTIEIDIPEQRQYLLPALEQWHFKLTSQGMKLIIDKHEEESLQELHFCRNDGMALCKMINEVVEEHEDLMSALC